uniref:Uncharacterized protein n=1 Tax=Amorphochlora amoebiformis TaxID=1561963 RepID=A0A6T6V446_9EUKA
MQNTIFELMLNHLLKRLKLSIKISYIYKKILQYFNASVIIYIKPRLRFKKLWVKQNIITKNNNIIIMNGLVIYKSETYYVINSFIEKNNASHYRFYNNNVFTNYGNSKWDIPSSKNTIFKKYLPFQLILVKPIIKTKFISSAKIINRKILLKEFFINTGKVGKMISLIGILYYHKVNNFSCEIVEVQHINKYKHYSFNSIEYKLMKNVIMKEDNFFVTTMKKLLFQSKDVYMDWLNFLIILMMIFKGAKIKYKRVLLENNFKVIYVNNNSKIDYSIENLKNWTIFENKIFSVKYNSFFKDEFRRKKREGYKTQQPSYCINTKRLPLLVMHNEFTTLSTTIDNISKIFTHNSFKITVENVYNISMKYGSILSIFNLKQLNNNVEFSKSSLIALKTISDLLIFNKIKLRNLLNHCNFYEKINKSKYNNYFQNRFTLILDIIIELSNLIKNPSLQLDMRKMRIIESQLLLTTYIKQNIKGKIEKSYINLLRILFFLLRINLSCNLKESMISESLYLLKELHLRNMEHINNDNL